MQRQKGPGFAVLYRWRVRPEREAAFVEAWSRITEGLLARGSFGSRLHKSADGLWYAYAQWPSDEVRLAAFAGPPVDAEARETLRASIEESFPEIVLESVSDFLVLPNR